MVAKWVIYLLLSAVFIFFLFLFNLFDCFTYFSRSLVQQFSY
uniref:Uncharacterized protein n=1 Tax=Arundo donax TaxID=35708 RepID=A0A0A9BVP4_ARUDO